MEQENRPKGTDAIKEKLQYYVTLQRRIDNQIERLDNLSQSASAPSSPNLTGMPSGGSNRSGIPERQALRKLELQEEINALMAEEKRLGKNLKGLVKKMENPDEQTVIQMHYFDQERWWPICEALYSKKRDYEWNQKKYLKKTFKLHGSALQSLAKIYNKTNT